MKTKSFKEELQTAKRRSYAVGAFNIFNYLSARAVIRAAQKLDAPVILQTSTQTVRKFGPQELGTMLRQLAWNASVNVIVHLDHCQNVEMAKACMDAGWDSVMFDGSHFPLEDNIRMTKEVIAYARHRGVYVEGELGRIAGVEDDLQVDDDKAKGATLEESLYYVRETGVDAFAPAVGTAHGVYKGTPVIDFDLVKALKEQIETPVVIHGGTGLDEDTFRRLIRNGGAKVNVSTAIKHAYIDGCKEYIQNNPDKLDPIDFDQYLNCAIGDIVLYHIELFRRDMK
ncbi:MAG: class II fructose-bisphosphate aldolase [Lachnospiraceae bacterium]|nr:class II fructose-bisphosphate aldolase [Lachnospiraceae bacterium]